MIHNPFPITRDVGAQAVLMKRRHQLSNEDFLEMENAAAAEASLISVVACTQLGVSATFISEWVEGAILEGAELAEPYFLDDYPALKENASAAADEFDRLTDLVKYFGIQMVRSPQTYAFAPPTSF